MNFDIGKDIEVFRSGRICPECDGPLVWSDCVCAIGAYAVGWHCTFMDTCGSHGKCIPRWFCESCCFDLCHKCALLQTVFDKEADDFDEEDDFDKVADQIEQCSFEDFRKGHISEEDLRETLEYYKTLGRRTRPSKYREIHIVEARLEIAKSLRALQGAVASSAPSKRTTPAKRKAMKKKR